MKLPSFLGVLMALLAGSLARAEPMPGAAAEALVLSPAELFALADAAQTRADYALAEQAYRALSANPDLALRSEARFRLALMLVDRLHRLADAAIELRKILDEQPRAARVRLELARVQAQLGNRAAAERELRAAQAAGLPADVERMVRSFANALGQARGWGGSVEVAIAPDSNINRATRSDRLGTVIGDFVIDPAARSQSGLGLALKGQAWAQTRLDQRTMLKVDLAASGDLYRDSRFDDYSISLRAGPEFRSGRDRIALAAGPGWRWYGRQPYAFSLGLTASWQHPLDRRTQLRVDGGAARIDNRRNALQDSVLWTGSVGIDRALSARLGAGVQLFASRDAARDPGFAMTSGGLNAYAYRELGPMTAAVSAGYSHLESDARLILFPRRRIDDRLAASAALTLRRLRIGPLAPVARLRWERNRSTIAIYAYRRVAGELGLTAAF